MKYRNLFLTLIVIVSLSSCDQGEKVVIHPLDNFKQVDQLLSDIAEKPQQLTAPSNKKTIVKGKEGTIIHVDPEHLETVDGSVLGDEIAIELLEMTDYSSLLLNNAPTISNGQLLVTGGAYYLNMTSDGKQLKMKEEKGLEVEFPKLTDTEMALFLGERDSLGQINWKPTEDKFASKNIPKVEKPKAPTKKKKKYMKRRAIDKIESMLVYIEGDSLASNSGEEVEVSEEVYQAYLKKKARYDASRKELAYQMKTYETINLMNFGWINCDRFLNDPNPRIDFQILMQNDSLTSARCYAVFNDIKSILTVNYIQGQKNTTVFRSIPLDKDLKIIALSAQNGKSYIFETDVNTKKDKIVQVVFKETTQEEIKKRLKRLK